MVLGARRKQALFTVIVDNIVTEENKMIFLQNKTSKHTNTLKPLEPLIYQRHPLKNKLCIVNVLCTVQCYLGCERIWSVVAQKSLLLHMVSHINLHHLTQYQDGSRRS